MAIRQPTSRVAGVLIPMIPVADLSRSVAFYTTLLGLELRREFVQDGRVTGAALGGSDLDFGLNLRLATTLAGPTDLRGEHPVVWRVDDRAALEEFRSHADALGLNPVAWEHDDAAIVRVVDPDGIEVFVGLATRSWTVFQGYVQDGPGYRPAHTQPLLATG